MTIFGINFTPELLAGTAVVSAALLILLAILIFLFIRKTSPRKIKKNWKNIQAKLPKQDKWREALIEADDLLDKALKTKNYTGKTTGEKLVKAEKIFSDKDELWYGHKLSRAVKEKPNIKLKKNDMKRALLAIRRGLKDLGAM